MKLRTLATLGLGSLILAGQPALAAAPVGDPLAGLQAMRELNAIVLGNAQGWLNVQGKSHIAGNLTGGGEFGGGNASAGAAASGRATLSVGGNVVNGYVDVKNGPNGSSGTVGNPATLLVGGNAESLNLGVAGSVAKIGGSLANSAGSSGTTIEAGGAGSGWLGANGGTITTSKGPAFATEVSGGIATESAKLEADLKALSLSLAQMDDTVGNSVVNQFGAYTFNAVSDANGVSVFSLSQAELSGWQFTLNLADPTATVIFNVSGASNGVYNWNTNLAGAFGPGFAGNVIWNFSDATSININQAVYGSILAPFANLSAQSALTGSVVSAGLKANSPIKLGTYDGGDLGFGVGADAVPEPATWAMLIMGFGLVGVAMRRRERIARTTA